VVDGLRDIERIERKCQEEGPRVVGVLVRFEGFTMVRKKIDNRIRVLIENGVTVGQRTMFVVVGDKGRDQVSWHFFRLI
jgi:hypothetical protein